MQQQALRAFAWTRTRSGFYRLAVFIGALLIVLILSGCTTVDTGQNGVISASNPQIFVEPEISQPGELVSVTGNGWEPLSAIYLNLDTITNGRTISAVVAVARTNSSGSFNISFVVPANWTLDADTTLTANSAVSDVETSIAFDLAAEATAVSETAIPETAAPTATATRPVSIVQSAATGRGQVTGEFVNVRQGPSTAYPVLFVAKAKDSFSILGRNVSGDWLRIRLDKGIDGWIAADLTDYTPAASNIFIPAISSAPNITQWRGEYFNNRTLSNAPILVRNDRNVKFDWGFSAPAASLPADNFSARWTRSLALPAGTYRFFVTADDGIRLWIDNEQVIDKWVDTSAQTFEVERTFATYGPHTFRIEYYEHSERAVIDFAWERKSDFPQWQGAYFPNRALSGEPALVRNDAEIDFDWGYGVPDEALSGNDFSVRWTRNVDLEKGIYRFHAVMDDGLRLYVDGNLLINEWRDDGEREVVVDYPVGEGSHPVRVEYYERGGHALARVWWEKVEQRVQFPDWKGEYWTNVDLSGSPAIVRNDSALNFNWGLDAPIGLSKVDNFSARWTRSAQFDSGLYRFRADVDDGVRVWIDDQLVIDDWQDGGSGEIVIDRQMTSGPHDIRVEYYERGGLAAINLRWARISDETSFPDWKGEYWSNRDLAGSPYYTRNDGTIDFNWSTNRVIDGMPQDNFSARWTRSLRFDKGGYRFYVRADDGVRVYIDGNLIINEWHANNATQVYVSDQNLDGNHAIKVEYYEGSGGARIEFWWQRIENTATPLPTPTNTSVPTETPLPTATEPATATPVVDDTPVPTEMPTLTPTAVVAPTNTAVPTAVAPTNTPEPTQVAPTDTPEPTAVPTEVIVPTDTPEPTPTEDVVGVDPVIAAAQNEATGLIDVEGASFSANVQAGIYLQMTDGSTGDESYGSAMTNDAGLYNISFAMPATYPDGSPIITGPVTIAVITEDGAQAITTFDYVAP